jgi:HK97 family phage prohead protease
MELEIRTSGGIRAAGGRLEGYAAVFNSETTLPGFTEIIRSGAFTKSLLEGRNVSALYQHNDAALLGTTRGGTLQLSEDSHGLKFSLALPSTSYGRDVGILVDRGDIQGCSFGFTVPDGGDAWTERNDGDWLRELRSVTLHEITITPNPAYADTTVALRSMPSFWEAPNAHKLWLETCR